MPDGQPGGTAGRLLAVAFGLTVAIALLALLEWGSRSFEPERPRPGVADYIWSWDKVWGADFYTVRSASVGWPPGQEFNRDGLRDRTHSREKPPRVFRLVVLGDSVTMGDGIQAHEAFPQVLQRRLDDAGRQVEVFNVGLWGWSTRQQRIAYDRIVRAYSPDRVVLAVCLNDIPELQNNLDRPPAWLAALHRHSALVRRLVDAPGREIRNVEALFGEPRTSVVRAGFERFFEEVRALRDAVRNDGADLRLLVFPFRFQVLDGAPAPTVQQTLADFARRESIPWLDLLPLLRPAGAEAFVDYDHLSPHGAELTAAALDSSGWVPQREPLPARVARIEGSTGLLAALTAPRPADREAAAWGLGHSATPAVAPALLATLAGDTDPGVRAGAATALGRLDPAGARAGLLHALEDRSEVVRRDAALALQDVPLAPAEALARFVPLLRSTDHYVRGFAAWRLGELGPAAAAAAPALLDALADGGASHAVVARALTRLGPDVPDAVPTLAALLTRGDDPRQRWDAAQALGRIGPRAAGAVPQLVEALNDPDARLRGHAARALGRVRTTDPRAVAALRRAARDGDAHVRAMAARALGWAGAGARPALPDLSALLRDRDVKVRREAAKALDRIQTALKTR